MLPIPVIWGITVAFGFLAWGVFAAQYIWPTISKRERAEALKPILVLHGFRYIGMAVLIPGVVSPELHATVFARGLAYGDLAAASLALIALARSQNESVRCPCLDFQHLWDCGPVECVLPGHSSFPCG